MDKCESSDMISSYGPVEGIVLLGGGKLLRKLCLWAKSEGPSIRVITSPRHAVEILDGESLSDFLIRSGVEYISVENIASDSIKTFLKDTKDYFYLSLGAAWIFKKAVIDSLFANRLFNLHGTRLPQNRGGGGFSWQILMSNKFGYCALHRVDGGLDTGEIIALEEFLYPATARKPIDFETVYIENNLIFVIDFIKKYRSQSLPIRSVSQSEYFSTYWPRLSTDINGWINWSLEPYEIEKFICAFDSPYAGAQTLLNGSKVRLKSVCLSPQDGVFHSYQSGIIYRKGRSWICIALKGSTLIAEGLYDDGGNDILQTVKVGDRFNTPFAMLDSTIDRPIYTPKGLKM